MATLANARVNPSQLYNYKQSRVFQFSTRGTMIPLPQGRGRNHNLGSVRNQIPEKIIGVMIRNQNLSSGAVPISESIPGLNS